MTRLARRAGERGLLASAMLALCACGGDSAAAASGERPTAAKERLVEAGAAQEALRIGAATSATHAVRLFSADDLEQSIGDRVSVGAAGANLHVRSVREFSLAAVVPGAALIERTDPDGGPLPGWGSVRATVQLTGYHARSSEFFGPDGENRPFLSNGRTTTSSLFITAAGGVAPGVELWVQVPLHRIGFTDETGSLNRVGIGDTRVSARVGGGLFGLDGLPVSVRAGVKLPGSDFPVDPDVLPISEGQTDIEVVAEAGRVLAGGYPLHVVGWAGYRWRLRNDDRERKPGDERFGRIGMGGPFGSLRWDLAVEGLWGRAPEQQGFILDGARRRLLQLLPTVGWRVGSTELEITGRFSGAGRNLPSGPSVSAGFLVPWVLGR